MQESADPQSGVCACRASRCNSVLSLNPPLCEVSLKLTVSPGKLCHWGTRSGGTLREFPVL